MSQKICVGSKEILKSELELFDVPPTNLAQENFRWKFHHVINTLDGENPLEFKIITGENEYLDPSSIILHIKARILLNNGTAVPIATAGGGPPPVINNPGCVYPQNYLQAALFKNVEVYLNNKLISVSDAMYAYKGYLQALLAHTEEEKETELSASLYYGDSAGDAMEIRSVDFATDDNNDGGNPGAKKRYMLTKESKIFEFSGRLHTELTFQDKLLMSKCELKIKMIRNPIKFFLMAGLNNSEYKFEIQQAKILAKHIYISDSLRRAHELTLEKRSIKYYIRQVQMRYFTRGPNRADLSETNVINGRIPRKIVVGMLDSRAFEGSYNHNCYNFQAFNLRQIKIRVNGEEQYEPIETDFTNGCVLHAYRNLLIGTDTLYKSSSCGISLEDFKKGGYVLFPFQLTANGEDGCLAPIKEGNVSLDISLNAGVNHAITIVVYAEYDETIELDKFRNVEI